MAWFRIPRHFNSIIIRRRGIDTFLQDFHRKRLGSGVGSAWFQMVPKNSVVFVDGRTSILDEALGVLGYTAEVLE